MPDELSRLPDLEAADCKVGGGILPQETIQAHGCELRRALGNEMQYMPATVLQWLSQRSHYVPPLFF